MRRKICRIEDPSVPGKALGTGFLVANDLVLTNYHVVSNYINGQSAAQLGCRFDYVVETTGEQPGTVQPVAPGQDWIVDYSKFSAFDPGDEGGLPNLNELDYALLRLANKVGDEQIPGIGKRGWIGASTKGRAAAQELVTATFSTFAGPGTPPGKDQGVHPAAGEGRRQEVPNSR